MQTGLERKQRCRHLEGRHYYTFLPARVVWEGWGVLEYLWAGSVQYCSVLYIKDRVDERKRIIDDWGSWIARKRDLLQIVSCLDGGTANHTYVMKSVRVGHRVDCT